MTVPVNTSTNITDLSNGNSAGTRLGQTTTDLVSFYGNTPIVQPAGNAGAVVQRGAGGAMVCTFSVTASPASVATDRKSTRLNSSHVSLSRMPSSA